MAEYIVLRNLAVDSKRAPGQGIGADDRGVGIVTAP